MATDRCIVKGKDTSFLPFSAAYQWVSLCSTHWRQFKERTRLSSRNLRASYIKLTRFVVQGLWVLLTLLTLSEISRFVLRGPRASHC